MTGGTLAPVKLSAGLMFAPGQAGRIRDGGIPGEHINLRDGVGRRVGCYDTWMSLTGGERRRRWHEAEGNAASSRRSHRNRPHQAHPQYPREKVCILLRYSWLCVGEEECRSGCCWRRLLQVRRREAVPDSRSRAPSLLGEINFLFAQCRITAGPCEGGSPSGITAIIEDRRPGWGPGSKFDRRCQRGLSAAASLSVSSR